jgi:hypothetical protein
MVKTNKMIKGKSSALRDRSKEKLRETDKGKALRCETDLLGFQQGEEYLETATLA